MSTSSSEKSVFSEPEIHPRRDRTIMSVSSSFTGLCSRDCDEYCLTAAKHPRSTWWIWQSCQSVTALGLKSLQSRLHNWENSTVPTHAYVEHHPCCKEIVTPLLLGSVSFITVEIVFLLELHKPNCLILLVFNFIVAQYLWSSLFEHLSDQLPLHSVTGELGGSSII